MILDDLLWTFATLGTAQVALTIIAYRAGVREGRRHGGPAWDLLVKLRDELQKTGGGWPK